MVHDMGFMFMKKSQVFIGHVHGTLWNLVKEGTFDFVTGFGACSALFQDSVKGKGKEEFRKGESFFFLHFYSS